MRPEKVPERIMQPRVTTICHHAMAMPGGLVKRKRGGEERVVASASENQLTERCAVQAGELSRQEICDIVLPASLRPPTAPYTKKS